MFSWEIMETLVTKTNQYHAQCVVKTSANTKLPWNDVIIEEVYAFLGIVIGMGIIKVPETRDYWSKSSISNVPRFNSILSHGRFKQILSNRHFAGNYSQPPKDDPNYKLCKFGTLFVCSVPNVIYSIQHMRTI